MRYQKPIVVELNASARASGQVPLSCMSGTGATAYEGVCGAGTSPTYNAACASGPANAGDCAGGATAAFTCLSGVDTYYHYECAAGTGGGAGSCTMGPSFV